MTRLRLVAALLAASPAWASYQYYLTDPLTSIDPNRWAQNGTVTATSSGLTSSDSNGGSVISKVAVPDGSSNYEVRATLALNGSGGTYVVYLRASQDALSGPSSSGTYYAFEIQNPTFDGSACTATLAGYTRVGGVVTLTGTTVIPCRNGMQVHAVADPYGGVTVYMDRIYRMVFWYGPIPAGQPGVGVREAPDGNSISLTELGPADIVAPSAINPQSVRVDAFPDHVEIDWAGVTDDPNGVGVWGFHVLRDGQYYGFKNSNHFTDDAVAPSTTYTYLIFAIDFHENPAPTVQFTVTTPPAGSIDPRRTGVRANGAYWGASGENIDTRSGNLNYTVPLVKPTGRGGWTVPFVLSYDSQIWRQDGGSTWKLGQDVGYGLGWRMLAGSLTPSYSYYWNIHHYTYTDASGAEYRLDINTNGVWTSREGAYVSFDANADRLYFPDGTFWIMGCESGGAEEDAGTLYPTRVEDTNGNYIEIFYKTGIGAVVDNSSARPDYIRDQHNFPCVPIPGFPNTFNCLPYRFTYNNDAIPHLVSIAGTPGESPVLAYATQTLYPPFGGADFGAATVLASVRVSAAPLYDQFQYNVSGELTNVTLPYGGQLRWDHRSFTYTGARTLREVSGRYLRPSSGAQELAWSLGHDDAGDAGRSFHSWTTLTDSSGQKYWAFRGDTGPFLGLLASWAERTTAGVALRTTDYTWATDAAGTPYTSQVSVTTDPGTSYAVQKLTQQTLDTHGNALQTRHYDYGNLSTPARTYTYTYLADPNYISRFIFNRRTSTVLTAAGQNTTLETVTYGGGGTYPPPLWPALLHDPAYDNAFPYRGNPFYRVTENLYRYASYDVNGTATSSWGTGPPISTSNSTGGADWLPASFSTGGNTLNFTYTSSLAVASITGNNGDTSTAQYDDDKRITQATSPDGAVTNYTYTFYPSANTAKATTGNRWKKTTLDGVGRTVREENGHDTVTVSTVDTEYMLCACSATGKVWRVSQPYAPNATVYWTTYTYDALGRTLTSTAPDGSVTSYVYQGNTTTVTDPTGKWKKFTSDAFGNLTLVTEPGNVVTSYSYDTKSRLINVSMTRDTGTQTRTFTYNANLLASTTQPENGTTQYTYDWDGYLTRITKNNASQIDYTYDGSGRRTSMTTGGNTVTWYYDGNPFDPNISTYAGGRLAAVDYGQGNVMREMYGYNPAGHVTAQRLVVGQVNYDATAGYEYDNEGRLTAIQYPVDAVEELYQYTPVKLHYSYDVMGRPNLLKGDFPNNYPDWQLATAQYGAAGELTQMAWNGGPQTNGISETRSYNPLRQLVRQTVPGVWDMEYRYTAGQNNGRITSQKEYVSGEEVTYQYDDLQRLIRAETMGPQWGQAYGYDGFGNLTSKTVTKGQGPTLSMAYNAATNHQIGGSYDGNGNWTGDSQSYDALGRATVLYESGGQMTWQYSTANKRMLKTNQWFGGCQGQWPVELNFYAPWGKRLVRYKYNVACYNGEVSIGRQFPGETYYFAGRTIVEGRTMQGGGPLLTDRLGSVQGQNGQGPGYKPYGEGSQNGGGEAFGTYQRDFEGQDWADQRYYTSITGRFWSPDPYQAAAKGANDPANPQSWNRYAYVQNDPINFRDPRGLFILRDDGGDGDDGEDSGDDYAFEMSDGSGGGSGPVYQGKWAGGGGGGPKYPGQQGARDALNRPDCVRAIGASSSTSVQQTLDRAVLSYGYTPNYQNLGSRANLGPLVVNVTPAGKSIAGGSGVPAISYTKHYTDYIALNGNVNWFFPDSAAARVAGTNNYTPFALATATALDMNIGLTSMSTDQFQALVILHELAHLLGAPQETSGAFNANIFQNCLR